MKAHPNTYALNVGTGSGTTVRELAAALAAVTGRPLHTTEVPRRPGDVVGAYTRIDRVIADLGWRPELSLEDGIRHSLQWLDRRSRVIPDLADPRATPMAYPSR
jgi:UDP-glucose 4-epimerase